MAVETKRKLLNDFLEEGREGRRENLSTLNNIFGFYQSNEKMNLQRFSSFLKDLFACKNGLYPLVDTQEKALFVLFDADRDDLLTREEFTKGTKHFFMNPALIVVDVQNDFVDGSMSVKQGPSHEDPEEIVPIINELRSLPFGCVVWTLDYHPITHCSFLKNVHLYLANSLTPPSNENTTTTPTSTDNETNPLSASDGELMRTSSDFKLYDKAKLTNSDGIEDDQTLWPEHCVEGTWGSELHPGLNVDKENDIFIRKGTRPDVDSYSAFWDNTRANATELESRLKAKGITHLFVCGLVYEVCVGATALDGLDAGFDTTLVEDATCGLQQKDVELVRQRLIQKGGRAVKSSFVSECLFATHHIRKVLLESSEGDE